MNGIVWEYDVDEIEPLALEHASSSSSSSSYPCFFLLSRVRNFKDILGTPKNRTLVILEKAKIGILPASSKGYCLNPKGWCIGSPYQPFSTPWKIQVGIKLTFFMDDWGHKSLVDTFFSTLGQLCVLAQLEFVGQDMVEVLTLWSVEHLILHIIDVDQYRTWYVTSRNDMSQRRYQWRCLNVGKPPEPRKLHVM